MYRTDDTGFGDIKVIQTEGYGYGVDAVLLAAFAAGETGATAVRAGKPGHPVRVCDLGTDCGIVAFIISHKIPDTVVTGIEKRQDAAARAEQAVSLNGLEDRVSIITADVADIVSGAYREEEGRYDAVVSNPPYFRRDAAIPSASDDRFTARHETTAGIEEFAKAAALMLRQGGDFYLVHRPDRLADIFAALRACGLEPKEMQMVSPRAGEPANIVLIHAVRDAGPQLRILPELPVHKTDGGYTEDILRIYERH